MKLNLDYIQDFVQEKYRNVNLSIENRKSFCGKNNAKLLR